MSDTETHFEDPEQRFYKVRRLISRGMTTEEYLQMKDLSVCGLLDPITLADYIYMAVTVGEIEWLSGVLVFKETSSRHAAELRSLINFSIDHHLSNIQRTRCLELLDLLPLSLLNHCWICHLNGQSQPSLQDLCLCRNHTLELLKVTRP